VLDSRSRLTLRPLSGMANHARVATAGIPLTIHPRLCSSAEAGAARTVPGAEANARAPRLFSAPSGAQEPRVESSPTEVGWNPTQSHESLSEIEVGRSGPAMPPSPPVARGLPLHGGSPTGAAL
jgi:hypothetical protein